MSIVNTIALAAIGAIGLNILNGYNGRSPLDRAFMAVGGTRRPFSRAATVCRSGSGSWPVAACGPTDLFGIPSLRIKGLYLAIATLAAQLIIEWTINTCVGSGAGRNLDLRRHAGPFWACVSNEFRRYYLILERFFLLAYFAAPKSGALAGWPGPSLPSVTATWRQRSSG